MKVKEAVTILETHNKWRRNTEVPNTIVMVDPEKLGIAIDTVVSKLKNNVLDVRKRYKFTFRDIETEKLIIIHENTERKAYKAAFRTFETPKDRELRLISKELNA